MNIFRPSLLPQKEEKGEVSESACDFILLPAKFIGEKALFLKHWGPTLDLETSHQSPENEHSVGFSN